jgi:homogentisate 1,2-dioxygenase
VLAQARRWPAKGRELPVDAQRAGREANAIELLDPLRAHRDERLGHLWPFAFNIGDFEPITGRVHQPPPVHLTFQPRNYVICSFVPRKFDYHPLAIPAPYNHSNINSDEVIYYVAGNFMSRRGVDISSFTIHPAGIPHGPHPGSVEASIGKEATEELAVMIDTFHPLHLTSRASELEDDRYPYSWIPPDDGGEHAKELSDRGPEAFPD